MRAMRGPGKSFRSRAQRTLSLFSCIRVGGYFRGLTATDLQVYNAVVLVPRGQGPLLPSALFRVPLFPAHLIHKCCILGIEHFGILIAGRSMACRLLGEHADDHR